MKLFKHVVRGMDQNVYFYFDEDTKEGVIVDPGDDAQQIIKLIDENEIKVKMILLTHGHGDHIGAVGAIKAKYGSPVAAHEWEIPVLADERANFSGMMGQGVSFQPDIILRDGDEIKVGDAVIKVIHTPGHTIGGVCFYSENDGILFSGDSLFYASIGRTDFPNPNFEEGKGYPTKENFEKLINSIKKVYELPEETVVLPGHGMETKIGFEKKFNPFVKG